MSVRELLATHTSHELAEWQAFERVVGFGDSKLNDTLAAIHEQLQLTNHLLGAAHFTDEEHPENPVPPPTRYPRGGEPPADEEDDEE